MIKKLFKKLFFKIISPEEIAIVLDENRINQCTRNITIGKGSFFYREAKVFNFRNQRLSIEIGSGTHIRGELLTFASGGKIVIGSNTYIGEGTRIWSANEIFIGSNVLISHNCNIIDTDSHEVDHNERAVSFRNMVEHGHSKEKSNVTTCPIFIDEFAWISYNVSILKGVKIGKGAIVGAGSVVTKDIPEYTVFAGNPAVFIKNIK